MASEIKKLFAVKIPCSNCPFREIGSIELTEGRLSGIKSDLLNNDQITFFCHKTTQYQNLNEDMKQHTSSYCMGAMAYLYAKGRINVTTRLGLSLGFCDVSDLENSIQNINTDE